MIDFENVSFAYDSAGRVLDGVSFHIMPGERVGLIGANGAGKSTLLKSALGLIAPDGIVKIDGMELSKANLPAIRQKLGYVLQDADNQMFMPTVFEDMIFGPMNYGMSREEAEKAADEALGMLGMQHLKHRHNHKISGGEKRMAAIATILAMHPKAILMDEPSSSLDPRNRRALIEILKRLQVTLLIASHDLDLVRQTCDRVLLLSGGKIAADGAAQSILDDTQFLEANGL